MKYLGGIFGLIVAIFIFTINADKHEKEDEHNEHHYITEKPWHLTTKYPTTEKWWHQNTKYPWYYTTEKWWQQNTRYPWYYTTEKWWHHTTGKLWHQTTKKPWLWHHTTEKFPGSWDHNHDHNNDSNHDNNHDHNHDNIHDHNHENNHDHNHDNNHYQNHDNVHATGLAPDPHSCHHFFSYGAGGTKYRLTCPSGTLFDKNLLICNHKYLVDC